MIPRGPRPLLLHGCHLWARRFADSPLPSRPPRHRPPAVLRPPRHPRASGLQRLTSCSSVPTARMTPPLGSRRPRFLLHLTAFTTLRALRTARHGAGLHLSALALFNLALLGMSTDVMDCIATLFSRVSSFSVFHIMLLAFGPHASTSSGSWRTLGSCCTSRPSPLRALVESLGMAPAGTSPSPSSSTWCCPVSRRDGLHRHSPRSGSDLVRPFRPASPCPSSSEPARFAIPL